MCLGTAKACVQTLLALLIWKNPVTFNALLGVFMVIFGSLLYTVVKLREDTKVCVLFMIEFECLSTTVNYSLLTVEIGVFCSRWPHLSGFAFDPALAGQGPG